MWCVLINNILCPVCTVSRKTTVCIPNNNYMSLHKSVETKSAGDVEEECVSIYFGPKLGRKNFFQMKASNYYHRCLQSNSDMDDSTGLRVYAAAHVAIRCAALNPELFEGKDICELGCGVGAAGLCTYMSSNIKSLLLTDGNSASATIAETNIAQCQAHEKVRARVLMWGEDMDSLASSFDVVIGCELMYYRVDLPLLLGTVTGMLRSGGIFFHAHIFRVESLAGDLIKQLAEMGLSSLEVPLGEVVDAEELGEHADWYNVRCLVSAADGVVEEILRSHPSWRLFGKDISDGRYGAEEEDDDDSEQCGFGNMMPRSSF